MHTQENVSKITTTTIYTCNICGNEYRNKRDALACSNIVNREIDIQVGDTIPIETRYDGTVEATITSVTAYKHGYVFTVDKHLQMGRDYCTDLFCEQPEECDELNFKAVMR